MGNLFSWLSAEAPLRGITAARYMQILEWKKHYDLTPGECSFEEYLDSLPDKAFVNFIRSNLKAGRYEESEDEVVANEEKLSERYLELVARFKEREAKYLSKERRNYATRTRARARQTRSQLSF